MIWTFSLLWMWGTQSWRLSKHFRYILYILMFVFRAWKHCICLQYFALLCYPAGCYSSNICTWEMSCLNFCWDTSYLNQRSLWPQTTGQHIPADDVLTAIPVTASNFTLHNLLIPFWCCMSCSVCPSRIDQLGNIRWKLLIMCAFMYLVWIPRRNTNIILQIGGTRL